LTINLITDKKNETMKPLTLKRGQRGKLKRIKEKYKDQDEDEREMRIKLLHVIILKIINRLNISKLCKNINPR